MIIIIIIIVIVIIIVTMIIIIITGYNWIGGANHLSYVALISVSETLEALQLPPLPIFLHH